MGLRDRIRDAVINAATDDAGTPNLARRGTQLASILADTAADHSNAAAYAVAGLGAAAVAAEGALSIYVYPPGDYAGFEEKGRRR